MAAVRARVLTPALVCWPALLSAVLCWPLLSGSGYPLARDLVFVPRQATNDATFGLGDGLPRAVPLDAVVSTLTRLVDGGVLARLVVPVAVALAGWGMVVALSRAGAAARFAAAGMAVWNPYVVERLALGQWALLLGYGALPWIFVAITRFRREGRARDLARTLAWSGLASLTPTGGALACAAVLAGGAARSRRAALGIAGVVLLQAPWVAAALLATAGTTSDPAGATVFGPDTDGPGGPAVALVALGGVWDDFSEPATRGTWLGVAAAALTCVVLVAGRRSLRQWWGTGVSVRVVVLVAVCAAVPFVASAPGGAELVGWLVREVPGAGLVRDSQKLLAPFVLLVVAAFGATVDRAGRRLVRHGQEVVVSGVLVLVALPFLVLPDATTVTWPTVEPVRYPAEVPAAYDALASDGGRHRVAVLPWRAYRLFTWGNGRTSSDPAERWLAAEVLTSGDLQVGDVLVAGESRLRADIGTALGAGRPADVLPRFGVDRVLVYRDDPDAPSVDLEGLVPLVESDLVAVYEVPGSSVPADQGGPRRALVVGAHLVWLVVAGSALVVTLVRRKRVG